MGKRIQTRQPPSLGQRLTEKRQARQLLDAFVERGQLKRKAQSSPGR